MWDAPRSRGESSREPGRPPQEGGGPMSRGQVPWGRLGLLPPCGSSLPRGQKLIQISAAAGLGVEFLVGKHLGLYVDPRIRYYFNCRQPKSIRTEQPLMAGVEMGLRIRL